MNKTRVYLFTGFLESGKSSFIQDTLLEQGFGEDEKTLIIAIVMLISLGIKLIERRLRKSDRSH